MNRRLTRRTLTMLALLALLVPSIQITSAQKRLETAGTGLIFSSFLGGNDEADEAWGVATDSNGDIYIVGDTFSPDFPATTGAYDTTYNGGYDVFVAKVSADGNQIIWATFLGGSSYEYGRGIAVDSTGVYVTGQTSSTDFPVTAGAYDTSFNGGHTDVFVAKMKLDGSALLWSTYMGGGQPTIPVTSDYPFDLAIDDAGNVYVAGSTEATDFPTTAGAYDKQMDGSQDGFVTKIKADGSALLYSTYLGGTSHEYCHAIAVDKSNQAYVTGRTYSTDFPTTAGAYNTVHNGEHDAYVTKLNANGSGLVYSTFIGGSDWDIGLDLYVDSAYRLYLSGATKSGDFPTTAGAYDRTHNGRWDAFALQLAVDGKSLHYSTLIGGEYEDRASGIDVDSYGNVNLVGDTISTNFPTTGNAFDQSHNGSWDAFVARLSSDGHALTYATYLGGHTWDEGHAIDVTDNDKVVVVGRTDSSTFPVTAGAFDTTFGSFRDAFVSKLHGVLPDIEVTALEITQGIQNLDNDIPLVANRATWARGYIAQTSSDYPFDVANVDARLQGYRDGAAMGSPLIATNYVTAESGGGDRLNLDDSFLFYVPPSWLTGTVTFTLEGNPPGASQIEELDLTNNTITETLTFNPVDTPCLIMVPVHLHNADGDDITYHTTEPGFQRIVRGLNRYHPIPTAINWWNQPTLYPAGHSKGLEWDLSNAMDRTTMLYRLWWRNFWTDDPEEGCHYIGMVSPDADTGVAGGQVLGKARVGGKEAWVKMEDTAPADPYWFQDGAQTLGHEVGHNKGLIHALCAGNEPDTDAAYPWPHPNCAIADTDPEGYYGFTAHYNTWGITRTVISNDPAIAVIHRGYPLMGYRWYQWISPWEYCKLLDTAYGVPCKLWNWSAVEQRQARALQDPFSVVADDEIARLNDALAYLVVGGWIDVVTGTAEIEDVYTLDALSNSQRAGAIRTLAQGFVNGTASDPFTLVQLDAGGHTLDTHPIVLTEDDEADGLYAFMEVMPLSTGVAGIEVRQNATTLATRVASAYTPTVALAAPPSGELSAGSVISWTASDGDDDALTFDLFYSPDNGLKWQPLAMGVLSKTWTLPSLDGIAGTEHGKLKILANDGFHTAEDIAEGTITVPNGAPLAIIISPINGQVVDEDDFLLFSGMATDDEDGPIVNGLTWSSSIDGAMSVGQEVTATLSPGTHQIMLTITDSQALTATDTVAITVIQRHWYTYLPVILR